MAKKRKISDGKASGPKPFGEKDGKLGSIKSYEDIADSEDEFHINRDKILLEDGPGTKQRRQLEEDDDFLEPSDEEILGDPSSDSEEDVEDEDNDVDQPTAKPKRRQDKGSSGEEEDEDAGGWGSSKRDYYNTDNIETEADALEEETEAKRLQQKKLQKMSEADFGFDENEWLDAEKIDGDDDVVTEVLKDVEITADMGADERLRLLQVRYPEFESLANEFLQLQSLLTELQPEWNTVSSKGSTNSGTRLALAKYRALAAYVGALTMYFAILTSTAKTSSGKSNALEPLELRDHSVMETLLQCRDLWAKVKNIKTTPEIEPEEEEVVEEDITGQNNTDRVTPTRESYRKKSKKELAREKAAAEALKSRAERIRIVEEELKDLSSLLPNGRKTSKASALKVVQTVADSNSDFGEEDFLTARTVAEKAAKKKSLRFYTSQIAQKSNRRADAGRDAGGDADLPHRERLRDRQARLNLEAERRGKKLDEYGRGTALGDDGSDEDGAEADLAQAVRSDENDYYDMVAQTSRKRKDDKAERYAAIAAAKAAGQQVRVVEGEVGEDGKRAIGYVIEKNKGLTPKRKMDVRNPRVKKRKKYEEKKKKLASMRPVYKGGEGRGGYGGELTGIKTGLIKSIKL